MTKIKSEKRITELRSVLEPILVCNNNKLRPFVEIIAQEPENIMQQNLGTLIGIFEISDTSEDSSYVVNYLISIIKKEYFAKPKRGPVESFEAALRKGNLALSKLAEHGNISWIGKLNAICAVIEKNRLHLTQTGTANAFLLRAKNLINISEGMSPTDAEPNPLKTFDNLSSGKIELDDKLIIATNNIFDIFSFEEIKKSALRFSDAEFVQFLKTALGNELETAAVLVIDSKQKEEKKPVPVAPVIPDEKINFFSQSSFERPAKIQKDDTVLQAQIQAELAKQDEAQKSQKNGHIYIKEAEHLETPKSSATDWLRSFNTTKANLEKKPTPAPTPAGREILASLDNHLSTLQKKISETKIVLPRNPLPKEKVIWLANLALAFLKKAAAGLWTGIKFSAEKIRQFLFFLGKQSEILLRATFTLIQAAREKRATRATATTLAPETATENANSFQKLSAILPDFSKIRALSARFTYEQKIYAALILVAVLVVPYFIAQYSRQLEAKKAASLVQEAPVVIIPLEQDKNVIRVENLATRYSGNALKPISLNGKMFGVAQTEIINLESKEAIAIPADFGRIDLATGMDDLNVIFLINKQDKKVLTWSPTNKKFQPNNINIPTDANIVAAETYLTYLYLVDATTSQIYRFPRAEGGFGEKSDWLKTPTNLAQVSSIAISENLLAASSPEIFKFFRGKKQDFSAEASATPIVPFKIYAKTDSQNIFILDKQNARVIKLDLSGNLIAQYYHADLATATDFAIDEANATVYISTASNIKSFSIN